jgi:hypothetical protein
MASGVGSLSGHLTLLPPNVRTATSRPPVPHAVLMLVMGIPGKGHQRGAVLGVGGERGGVFAPWEDVVEH